jgi:hypothetical protein
MPWRYVKNNNYASRSFPLEQRGNRLGADRLYRFASLLYHELSHANDFFPNNEWFSHPATMRVLDAAQSTSFESDSLSISYPLASDKMKALAQVSFNGNQSSVEQIALSPSDIAQFFSTDDASDYYSYSSEREDYAMLFEELMMQTRYGVLRDVAITNRPQADVVTARDYIVHWGQRGRIGEDNIKTRVAFVATRVLPELEIQTHINALPMPIAMLPGQDWMQNLTISQNKLSEPNKTTATNKLIEQRSYYHKPLPKK